MTSTTLDRATGPDVLPARHADQSALRLTRRGRVVVLTLALLAILCLLALRGAPAASTDVVHHPRTEMVIVTPGDTLWDIARRADPAADPRDVVAQIEVLNSLPDDGVLHVGEPLFVPAP